MGVTLCLRLIDHARIVEQGTKAVDAALSQDDPELLRDYLRQLPIDVNPAVVDMHVRRLAKLRELNAPAFIIANDERMLQMARGDAYRPPAFENASIDELRELLGTWCWMSRNFDLDKTWSKVQWFLDPAVGPDDALLYPRRPGIGDEGQSLIDQAFQGSMEYPLDCSGTPIIRTLGSSEAGCTGYNPPAMAAAIAKHLDSVDTASWKELIPVRRELHLRSDPNASKEAVESRVNDELTWAREGMPLLVAAYSAASSLGFGVSCEYTI